MSSPLLQPLELGSLRLKNRIIMAPLTRSRATGADGRTPNDMMKDYYVQRATAGLIISEATAVTPMGVGYANTPGIWSQDQINGWKRITEAVHAANGKMILQLWHVGRISHPMFLGGKDPVSASAIAASGHVSLVRPQTPYPVPRALELSEIPGVIAAYKKGAENAKLAGFDGVEVHGANGYLLDQFLQDGANKRTDEYGGATENRARLMLEVADAAIEVWGSDKVGMHLSTRHGTMSDSNPEATFGYVASELAKRKIAFLCVRESEGPLSLGPKLKRIFKGNYIGNEQFTVETAEAAMARGDIDAVAFGRDFISNPDLVKRIELKAPYNAPRPETFYSSGAEGYTDYPFMKNDR